MNLLFRLAKTAREIIVMTNEDARELSENLIWFIQAMLNLGCETFYFNCRNIVVSLSALEELIQVSKICRLQSLTFIRLSVCASLGREEIRSMCKDKFGKDEKTYWSLYNRS